MAKSKYLYAVTEFDVLMAEWRGLFAFEVKHECVTWLRKNPPAQNIVRYLHRLEDDGNIKTEMDIKELLK